MKLQVHKKHFGSTLLWPSILFAGEGEKLFNDPSYEVWNNDENTGVRTSCDSYTRVICIHKVKGAHGIPPRGGVDLL
jgi:hypothetical protein